MEAIYGHYLRLLKYSNPSRPFSEAKTAYLMKGHLPVTVPSDDQFPWIVIYRSTAC
jgi:hypothetical protein